MVLQQKVLLGLVLLLCYFPYGATETQEIQPLPEKISFFSDRDEQGQFAVYLMEDIEDTTSIHRVSPYSTLDDLSWAAGYSWSPDGNHLAYSKGLEGDPNYKRAMFIFNIRSGQEYQLTDIGGYNLEDPVWSPDGTQIAYVNGIDRSELNLYVINIDGTQTLQLTETGNVAQAPVTWSPDGQQLSFAVWNGENYDIHIIESSGNNLRPIIEHEDMDFAPTWSPDGSQLAFKSNRNGFMTIYLFDILSNKISTLDRQGILHDLLRFDSAAPTEWSRDGKRLLFSWDWTIYTINTDGSDLKLILDEHATYPQWVTTTLEG